MTCSHPRRHLLPQNPPLPVALRCVVCHSFASHHLSQLCSIPHFHLRVNGVAVAELSSLGRPFQLSSSKKNCNSHLISENSWL
jgi:hypothetical protein